MTPMTALNAPPGPPPTFDGVDAGLQVLEGAMQGLLCPLTVALKDPNNGPKWP